MSPDVRGFYAALDVDLGSKAGPEITVNCFSPDHDDRSPSCNVHIGDGKLGVFNCHSCGIKGGPYDAAVLVGCSPADAMNLLKQHGLAADDRIAPAPSPKPKPPQIDEAQMKTWRDALAGDSHLQERLSELRNWSPEAVERLGLGFDGQRIVFPVRSAVGELLGATRYAPNPETRTGSKMLAITGSPRRLFPPPETLSNKEPVVLCEGEPDAVTAASMGLNATGLPGVKSWQRGWADSFAGRKVIVCLDCDSAGRTAASEIAVDLALVAAEVRVLDIDPTRDDGFDLGDLFSEARSPDRRVEVKALFLQLAARAQKVEAEPVPELPALLTAVRDSICRFVVLPNDQAGTALALFVAHSYVFEAAYATPYFVVASPEKRSGKTRLLEVLGALVREPLRASGLSEAVLYRAIQQKQPTLLLDEIDAIFGSSTERVEPIRGVLNAGNRSGSFVYRMGGERRDELEEFSVFCPKVLAGISNDGRRTAIPDTITDRAISIRMKRKLTGEPVDRFRPREFEAQVEWIVEGLSRWSDAALTPLKGARPEIPIGLSDRAEEAWEPLLAIADFAGGSWPQEARQAALVLSTETEPEEQSRGIQLLAAAREVYDNSGLEKLSSEDLCFRINALDEYSFGGWRDGKGIDPRGLGKYLREYGVAKAKSVRLDDGSTPKGRHRDDFRDAWTRYLPTCESPPQPPQVPQDPPSATEKPHEQADVADVADVALNPEGVA